MIDSKKYSLIYPARIKAYDPTNQTATVIICAERIYSNSFVDDEVVARKEIYGVPVHTPSGGGWAITMPITAGDTCLLFFSQVGYDHWLYNDADVAGTLASLPKPWLKRQFSEDDGIALVGVNTLPRAISGVSGTASQWRDESGNQKVSLNSNGTIDIGASSTEGGVATLTTITVTGSKLVVIGDLEVDGNITCTGTVDSGGEVTANSETLPVALSAHTHPYVNVSTPATTSPPTVAP